MIHKTQSWHWQRTRPRRNIKPKHDKELALTENSYWGGCTLHTTYNWHLQKNRPGRNIEPKHDKELTLA